MGTEAKKVDVRKIKGLARSLTLVGMEIKDIDRRLKAAEELRSGDAFLCIIDIQCCIIDCSNCGVSDLEEIINPADTQILEGFFCKWREQMDDANAPVYYIPDIEIGKAFKLGHHSLEVPGSKVEGRLLGLLGEFVGEYMGKEALKQRNLSPTAPVIALTPK